MLVFRDKLLGVLYLITQEWESGFDNSDYQTILYGLTQTNVDINLFFAKDFYNQQNRCLTLLLARDVDDTDIILIKSNEGDEEATEILSRIDNIQSCFSSWRLNNQEYWE